MDDKSPNGIWYCALHFTAEVQQPQKRNIYRKNKTYRLEMHLLSHKLISTKENINQVAFIILANL